MVAERSTATADDVSSAERVVELEKEVARLHHEALLARAAQDWNYQRRMDELRDARHSTLVGLLAGELPGEDANAVTGTDPTSLSVTRTDGHLPGEVHLRVAWRA